MSENKELKKIQVNIQIDPALNSQLNQQLDDRGLQKSEVFTVMTELWLRLDSETQYALINKASRVATIDKISKMENDHNLRLQLKKVFELLD